MMNCLHVLALVGPAIYLTSVAGLGVYLVTLAFLSRVRQRRYDLKYKRPPIVRKSDEDADSDAQLQEVSAYR